MINQNFFQTSAKLAISVASSCVIAGVAAYQPAQAASFTSTVTLSGTNSFGGFVPLATSTFKYNKEPLISQQFGYTLESLTADVTIPFLPPSYNLDSLNDLQTYTATLQTLVPTGYQSIFAKYQGVLTNAINRRSGSSSALYDYVGDGDFPPPPTTLTFTAQDIPSTSSPILTFLAQSLFPSGGRITFASIFGEVLDARPSLTFTPQTLAAYLTTPPPATPQPQPIDSTPISSPQTEVLAGGLPATTDTGSTTGGNTAAVPEPATMVGAGLAAGAAAIARRRKKMAA